MLMFNLKNLEKLIINTKGVLFKFAGVYGRRNVQPTHTTYDFFHVFDGAQIAAGRVKRSQPNVSY